MSETGDLFKLIGEASKAKRAANRTQSTRLLTDKGIRFNSSNAGAHLIVTHNDTVVDFWPGTGKWIIRGSGEYCRGVFNLLKAIKG